MLNHFRNGSFIYLYKTIIWLGGVLPAIIPSIQVGVDVNHFRNGSFIYLHKTIIWLGGVLPAIGTFLSRLAVDETILKLVLSLFTKS